MPKELLPVGGKPMIQYAVEEAAASGIEQIGIILSAGKAAVKKYFLSSPETEIHLEFTFLRQKLALGLGHAILQAEKYIDGEPFAVLSPDNIFDGPVPCLKQLLRLFAEMKSTVVALEETDEEGTKKYAIIKGKEIRKGVFLIEGLIEKPGPARAFSNLAIPGRYVFENEIFDAVRRTKPGLGGEVQITDAIGRLLETRPVYGLLFRGKRYDAGDIPGFIQANLALHINRLTAAFSLAQFLTNMLIIPVSRRCLLSSPPAGEEKVRMRLLDTRLKKRGR
jgi:UTP--glucose-1-phosphate uridylyltransferase